MAPELSFKDGILPEIKEVKNVSGMEVSVCFVVDILWPPTFKLMTSEEGLDGDKTGRELGISVDFLLEEVEEVLLGRALSGDLHGK